MDKPKPKIECVDKKSEEPKPDRKIAWFRNPKPTANDTLCLEPNEDDKLHTSKLKMSKTMINFYSKSMYSLKLLMYKFRSAKK